MDQGKSDPSSILQYWLFICQGLNGAFLSTRWLNSDWFRVIHVESSGKKGPDNQVVREDLSRFGSRSPDYHTPLIPPGRVPPQINAVKIGSRAVGLGRDLWDWSIYLCLRRN